MKAKARKAGLVLVAFLLVQVLALLVVALWPITSGGGRSSGPTPVTERAVTLEEAKSLLDFDVKLPSFLPEATSPTPALYVESIDQGETDWLEAIFPERDPATETGLSIRIIE